MIKKLQTIFLAGFLVCSFFVVKLSQAQEQSFIPLKATSDKILEHNETTILSKDENGDFKTNEPVVIYKYITTKEIPPKQFEIFGLRTNNSQTFLQQDGKKILKLYTGSPFYFDSASQKWFETAFDYTTPENFKAATDTLISRIKNIFLTPVLADIFPSTTDDCFITSGNKAVWADAYNAVTGTPDCAGENIPTGVKFAAGNYGVNRNFFKFDTSVIGTDNVDSGIFYFMPIGVTDTDSERLYLVETTNTSFTDGSAFARSNFDMESDLGNILNSALTAESYAGITLTASGLTNINKTGYTYFSMVGGFDRTGTDAPTGHDDIDVYPTETTGTGKDPYLELVLSEEEPPPGPIATSTMSIASSTSYLLAASNLNTFWIIFSTALLIIIFVAKIIIDIFAK